jgi:adenylate cyclase
LVGQSGAAYHAPSIQVTAREQDMNAPPNIDLAIAHSDRDVLRWPTNETLCVRLQRAGIPVKRTALHVLISHPQWLGARVVAAGTPSMMRCGRKA